MRVVYATFRVVGKIKGDRRLKSNSIRLYNVSFGIFVFMPPGWFIILLVLILETIIMSKFLKKVFYDKAIMVSTIVSNLISGIIGIFLSMYQNGGWWLVCWFPWVSKHEVNANLIKPFIIYFIIALTLSVLIECIVNYIFLRKKYDKKRIVLSTLLANICSNLPIVIILYLFSFVWI